MNKLSKFGVGLTAAYLIVIVIISVSNWLEFSSLRPNEWGDFLAGAFGPLAIFWLVLGFFQQGHELRHSVQALELQAEELKNSVEQQRAMVSITERQLNLDIEVRTEQNKLAVSENLPYFQAMAKGNSGAGGKPSTRKYSYNLTNIGADAATVKLALNTEDVSLGPKQFSYTPKQTIRDFYLTTIGGPNFPETSKITLTVDCENIRGQTRRQVFSIGNFHPKLLSCEPEQS